jgi:hypothetical protein
MAAAPREALAAAQDDLTGVTAPLDGGWTWSSTWCLLMMVIVIDGKVDAHNLLVAAAIGGRG